MKFFKGRKDKKDNTQNEEEYDIADIVENGGETGFLQGNFLVSTIAIQEPCFGHSVVFIANHDETGAMGLIVNKELKTAPMEEVLKGLSVENEPKEGIRLPLHFGGPVETTRGFVMHSDDYKVENTVTYPNGIAITSEKKAVEDYITGNGAKEMRLILGYAGWVPGQLEKEIEEGAWITVPASADIAFGADNDEKWQKAANNEGIDIFKLNPFIGRA